MTDPKKGLMMPPIEVNSPATVIMLIDVALHKGLLNGKPIPPEAVDLLESIRSTCWQGVHYLRGINRADQVGAKRPPYSDYATGAHNQREVKRG